jgi:hypothetical protein
MLTRIAAAAVTLAALAAPAGATTVVLKDGSSTEADRLHYTYTHLVVITPDNDMRLIPNDQVQSIDGISFTRAYWDDRPGHSDGAGSAMNGTAGAGGLGVAIDRLMPLKPGTFRRYDLESVRTTWVRHGRTMERRETIGAAGSVRENVTGPVEGSAALNLLEVITEKAPGRPAHEVTLRHRIEGRADGYYLVGQEMEDANLAPPIQEDRITDPPRLWPQDLSVGQSWVVGPFTRMGLGQVAKMEVVGVEAITVAAGAYPEAYKVVGKGNVFGGTQLLRNGRLVTDHGTLETTTWIVPGIGPVRELSKVHLHQDFFPYGERRGEIPIVVEEESTRTLAEFHAGQ